MVIKISYKNNETVQFNFLQSTDKLYTTKIYGDAKRMFCSSFVFVYVLTLENIFDALLLESFITGCFDVRYAIYFFWAGGLFNDMVKAKPSLRYLGSFIIVTAV